jgi:cellulose synthase/poly-beta-1,6-N-acetylglucosamine synthase-like glycosyltransferase
VYLAPPGFVRVFLGSMGASVIVPTLNEEEVLGNTLEDHAASTAEEVIAVDEGSRDRTQSVAEKGATAVIVEAAASFVRSRGAQRPPRATSSFLGAGRFAHPARGGPELSAPVRA